MSHAPTVVIENFYPCLDGGRHPVKRVIDETLDVWCDIFKDGHDVMSAVLRWRTAGSKRWFEAPMKLVENDRWHGQCRFSKAGRWEYVVEAWGDTFRSWKKTFAVRVQAKDPDVPVEALEGARLLRDAAKRARTAGATASSKQLEDFADLLSSSKPADLMDVLLSDELQSLMDKYPDRSQSTTSDTLSATVERERARFSAWYEFFPRGAEGRSDKHSTFRDCLGRLDHAAHMGFDVIYFPPIHPIGVTARKGKNNTLTAKEGDVGSPWAIGGPSGGHYNIEPALGTEKDFVWLVKEAKKRGLEIALDFALNCSPDHPYVKDHPEWFYQRPDGSIRYAENPPKKYQDIYPINFDTDPRGLDKEILRVVRHWINAGVKIFRVDNPHTKPPNFWETLISEVKKTDPDVLFLAEAFTRPARMYGLARRGFTQSYTYFTWRVAKWELTEFGNELAAKADEARPNLFVNTPDILHESLQHGGPGMFALRAALAATLAPTWGVYSGYELYEHQAVRPGSEEYLDSEKYELRPRRFAEAAARGESLEPWITALNRIRRAHPALQQLRNLHFHHIDNDALIAYSKFDASTGDAVLTVINLNPFAAEEGTVWLDMPALGREWHDHMTVLDEVTGEQFN